MTERRDVLSTFFFLLAVLAYLRAVELESPHGGAAGTGSGSCTFALALGSKSITTSLPVVLLILDIYPLRRVAGSVASSASSKRRRSPP